MGPVWIEMQARMHRGASLDRNQAIQAMVHRGASLDRQLLSPGYLGRGASLGWTILMVQTREGVADKFVIDYYHCRIIDIQGLISIILQ